MSNELIASLIEQLSDRNGLVRERSRHNLVLIGEPAVPSLVGLLGSQDKRSRWEAAKALGAIADPSSIPALVRTLHDPESDVRWLAGVALIRLGARSIPFVLKLLIDRPDSVAVRRSAHHVFSGVGKRNRLAEELLGPVMDALGDTDPPSAIPPKAEEALKRFRSIRGEEVP